MAIAINDAAAVVFEPTDAADPQTGTYTISAGSDRLLLVWVIWEINNVTTPITVSSVTWGGQTMTSVRANSSNVNQTTTEHMELFKLQEAGIAAASGSTLSVDFSAEPTRDAGAIAICLSGADDAIEANDNANNDIGSISTTIALASGNWALACVSNEASDGAGFTKEGDVTVQDIDNANATGNAGFSYCFQRITSGSGTKTLGVTACGNVDKDMVIIACEASAAAGGGGGLSIPIAAYHHNHNIGSHL